MSDNVTSDIARRQRAITLAAIERHAIDAGKLALLNGSAGLAEAVELLWLCDRSMRRLGATDPYAGTVTNR